MANYRTHGYAIMAYFEMRISLSWHCDFFFL